MAQRIEFRFGKNSSFECEVAQIVLPREVSLDQLFHTHSTVVWVRVKSSTGGIRLLNVTRCTQILIGMPDTGSERNLK